MPANCGIATALDACGGIPTIAYRDQGPFRGLCVGVTVIQRTWDWLATVEAATQMKPIIYSYPSWFATFGFTDPRLTAYPLWIASPYSSTCATVPAPCGPL